ncbi:cytochrome b5-like heme/steroid binding domain-containing protein [Chytriomyces cf. hyalinus JEL632]|nr:cytochrome b5-like heme/steroid binding domain-containing protein [Chytriomyces cf. hyalinus JEL632]
MLQQPQVRHTTTTISSSRRLFTPEELSQFNGNDPSLPIYIALKGVVYDVTARPDLYAPGGQCAPFAGKDASYAFGKSARGLQNLTSDKVKSDVSELNEEELEALENWVAYYETAYKIVGRMT